MARTQPRIGLWSGQLEARGAAALTSSLRRPSPPATLMVPMQPPLLTLTALPGRPGWSPCWDPVAAPPFPVTPATQPACAAHARDRTEMRRLSP